MQSIFCFFLVAITITATSGNKPSKPQIVYLDTVFINEEQSYENYLVYNFNDHLAASSTYRLEMLSSNSNPNHTIGNKFRLVSSTYLHLTGAFDRESLVERNECEQPLESASSDASSCIIHLKVALYNNESALSSLFILPISILDVNDQRPKFKSSVYYLNVSENLPARTSLPLEMPIDLDSEKFNVRECHLVTGSNQTATTTNDYQFDVFFSQAAKSLHLFVNSPLDRENKSSYVLTLVCSDGRFKARAQLILEVLDANDNMPVVKEPKLNVSVAENMMPEQQRLIRVEAWDLDDEKSPNGKLVYSLPAELNSAEIRRLFDVENDSGWINLKEPLDYEKARKHVIKVKVEDMGVNSVPAYAEVLVSVLDTNDNAPICQLSYSETYILGENRSNRTIWLQEEVEASPFAPIILAYLTLSDVDSAPANGHSLSASLLSIRYLNVSSPLNTPEMMQTEMNSTPSFRLTPIITQYGNYYYALEQTARLDREKTIYFDLTLRLSDNTNSPTDQKQSSETPQISYVDLRVILTDLNDNFPEFTDTEKLANDQGVVVFEYFKFSVPENEQTLNFGSIRANDADSTSRLEYRILDENSIDLVNLYSKHVTKSETQANRARFETDINPNYLFFIRPENGTLSLRAELDRERKDVYLFTVRVNDSQHASDVLVEVTLVDVNDNQPIYSQSTLEVNLKENTPENTIIASVKPTDPDLNPITEYFIEPSLMTRFFYIEPETGNLMTRVVLDAEDSRLNEYLTPNNTFEMTIYVRDPLLVNSSNIDWHQMSKLNVSIHLEDVNDNRPEVRNPENNLIGFDLNRYPNSSSSCENMNLGIKTIETVDLDRDTASSNSSHLYRFAYIRRLSWPFVYEIVKTYVSSNQSNTSSELLGFVESLVNVQNRYDIRPLTKVNLRSVFQLDQRDDRQVLNQVNVTLNQLCKLNWGVYNLSIQVNENIDSWSDYSLKLFVYNSMYDPKTSVNLTSAHLDLLDTIIESWWSVNAHLIAGLKQRTSTTRMQHQSDDNGDYIDGITQEYFKFYATSAFSRFNSKYQSNGGLSFFDFTNFVGQLNSASNYSIIVLISAFLLVSIVLIIVILYKHSRGGKSAAKKKANSGRHSPGSKKSSSSHFALNVSKSSDSSSASSVSTTSARQSTKDLSGSPDLVASKINFKKGFKTTTTSTTSSTSSSTSSNLILYPAQHLQQQQQQKIKQLPPQQSTIISSASSSNEQRYVKCEHAPNGSSSICGDSFTVITSMATGESAAASHIAAAQHQRLSAVPIITAESASSSSSSPSSSTTESSSGCTSTTLSTQPAGPSTTTVYISSGGVSTPAAPIGTVLSTFSPLATSGTSSSTSSSTGDYHQHQTAIQKQPDQGYYGSSDYSENNSFMTRSGAYQADLVYMRQPINPRPRQSTSQQQVKTTTTTTTTQSNSGSFASSSLMSSPSSSTDYSYSSDFLHHQPASNRPVVVTNLYPIYQSETATTTQQSTDQQVKIYLEKFERIYNGPDSTATTNSTSLNTFNKQQQRNSMTTYSYV